MPLIPSSQTPYRLLAWTPHVAAPPAPQPVASQLAPGAEFQALTIAQELQRLRDLAAHFISTLGSVLFQIGPLPTPQPSTPPSSPSPAPAGAKARFIVSSFNILGSSHTQPGADMASWQSGIARLPGQVALLRQKNISVVGFQEMCNDQASAFKKLAGNEYALYPGPSKNWRAPLNSIGWRKSEWDFVKGATKLVPSFMGDMRPFTIVTLKNKQTGKNVIFLNLHNSPGHTNADQQRWRDEALSIQTAMIRKLRQETGLPVVVTGDMNEQGNSYDRMRKEAGMHASNEGPKGQRPKHLRIEWIFGSDGVKFDAHGRDSVTKRRQLSDHDLVWSGVTV